MSKQRHNGKILNPEEQNSGQRAESQFQPMHIFSGEVTGDPIVMPASGPAPPKKKALRMSSVGYNLINNKAFGTRKTSQPMGETGRTTGAFLTANKYDVRDIMKGHNPVPRNQMRMRGITVDEDQRGVYAGVRKNGGVGQMLTEGGSFLKPYKNTSKAFDHLPEVDKSYL